MKRSGIILAGALALLLAGALWFRSTMRPDAAPAIAVVPPSAVPTPEIATQPASRVTTGSRPQSARRGEKRAALADDPEYRRHLAGFTGRVVTSAGVPVAGCPVRMHEFDPARSFVTRTSVFEAARPDLDVDVGSTETDAAGRYRIDGAEPLARFLLVAGDGNASPFTLQPIQRTPAPGELVDLGDLVLRDAVTLRGRVVDERGAPVANALVRAAELDPALLAPFERFEPEGHVIVRWCEWNPADLVLDLPPWAKARWDELPMASTRSLDDGSFVLHGVAVGSVTIAITSDGNAPHMMPHLVTKLGEARDLGDLVSSSGMTARGAVLDTNNEPVAGAEVLIAPTSPGLPYDFAGRPTRSDAHGNFAQPGFSAGLVTIACRRGPHDPWTVSKPRAVQSDLLVTLPARANLTLRLEGTAVTSFDEVELRVLPRPKDREMLTSDLVPPVALTERCDRLGPTTLRIRELPCGSYLVVARSPGCTEYADIVELTGDRNLALRLKAGRMMLVRVVDASGEPVAHASVHGRARKEGLSQLDGNLERFQDAVRRFGTTGLDGRLEVLVPGDAEWLILSVQHPGLGNAHAAFKLPARDVVVHLLGTGTVEGVLTENGRRVTAGSFVVEVTRDHAKRASSGVLEETSRFAVTDSEGRFRFTAVAPGYYRASARRSIERPGSIGVLAQALTASDDGFEWFTHPQVQFEIESARTTTIAIDTELQPIPVDGPSGQLSGMLTIDGRPGAGMVLWLSDPKQRHVKIDTNGHFDFGPVPTGKFQLDLFDSQARDPWRERPWARNVTIEAGKEQVLDLHLHFGSIEGTVLDGDGTPARDVEVHAVSHSDGPDAGLGHWGASQTLTDAAGHFQIGRLSSGTCELAAMHGNDSRARADKIELGPGAHVRGVELRLQRTFTVRGVIDLKPLGTARVSWAYGLLRAVKSGLGDGWCEIDTVTGSVKSTGLLPGTYRLFVVTPAGTWAGTHEVQVGTSDQDDAAWALQPEPIPDTTKR